MQYFVVSPSESKCGLVDSKSLTLSNFYCFDLQHLCLMCTPGKSFINEVLLNFEYFQLASAVKGINSKDFFCSFMLGTSMGASPFRYVC